MQKCGLGLVFGGASSEYEVSLMSVTSVLNNIDREKYDIHMVGITKEGRMFSYTGGVERIQPDQWQGKDCVPCVISPDRAHHGILLLGERTEVIHLDCLFPVLHGKNGEDGTIQGLCAMAGIPCVGCGCRASAVCMDKAVTRILLEAADITGVKWLSVTALAFQKEPKAFLAAVESKLGYPCFVKPANAGSSVGITKAADRASLCAGMELALAHDNKVVVEEMARGIELECAVLGNDAPIVSCVGEIVPCNEFYDYDAKYLADRTETFIPARIPAESAEKIRETAVRAFLALNCAGLARVDFFLQEDGTVLLNEPNTIPGFTKISMYPKLFEAGGLAYPDLIDRLISLAMEKR